MPDAASQPPAPRTKSVTFLTRCTFWLSGTGWWARTNRLVHYLAAHTRLTVVFFNPGSREDLARRCEADWGFRLVVLGDGRNRTAQHYVDELYRYRLHAPSADAYIIDKTELTALLNALPAAGLRLVDTHDLISERTESAQAYGAREDFPLSREKEIAALSRYDGVICIQPRDADTVAGWIGRRKVILAPTPVEATRWPLRDPVRSIGLTASRWHANVDGLRWFLDEVWPLARRDGVTLDVFGSVAESFAGLNEPGVRMHGFVERLSDCYENMGIAINPVRYGAGLKTKTIEAMAHGLPQVTTTEGARGLGELVGRAFLTADAPNAFADALARLMDDASLRRSLSEAAYAYAAEHFTPRRCFDEVLRFIEMGAASGRGSG
jgi:glycosyltransferase involved in cell wall biosynthesis